MSYFGYEAQNALEQVKGSDMWDILCNIVKNKEQIEWEGCKIVAYSQKGLVSMPDGTVLYSSSDCGSTIHSFRYGKWVERIKAYSEQITAHEQQEKEAEERKKPKPFSPIDF